VRSRLTQESGLPVRVARQGGLDRGPSRMNRNVQMREASLEKILQYTWLSGSLPLVIIRRW
jgi:hypothetical protein